MNLVHDVLGPMAQLAKQYPWLGYVLEVVLLFVAAWVLRRIVVGYLGTFAKRTPGAVDDKVVALVGSALRPLLLLAIVTVTLNSLPIRDHILVLCNRLATLATLVVVLFYTYRAVLLVVAAWLERNREHETLLDPVRFFVRLIFAGLAITLVLDNLGVSLTAVWTTLGVGSVAVALALQDTLSNFFAGVYLRIDRPVRVGDYVKLESKEEGFVAHLGWRSTRMRTLSSNVVVVPNSKLASAIVTNYSLPDAQMWLSVGVAVSYDADANRVERG